MVGGVRRDPDSYTVGELLAMSSPELDALAAADLEDLAAIDRELNEGGPINVPMTDRRLLINRRHLFFLRLAMEASDRGKEDPGAV